MNEREKGEARAQGALASFLAEMVTKIRDRPLEYRRAFWREMQLQMRDMIALEDLANVY
mgnify:FL=1